jgi:hypothetical protein
MTWEIDFTHLTARHSSGLQVKIIPDGKKMYFFKPVEGTEHHLEDISNKNLCIAELAAALARFLERRH